MYTKTLPKTPPSAPSTVFLGDTFSISLCLPKILPAKYANVSAPHAPKNTSHTVNAPFFSPLIKIICANVTVIYTVSKKSIETVEKRTVSCIKIIKSISTKPNASVACKTPFEKTE